MKEMCFCSMFKRHDVFGVAVIAVLCPAVLALGLAVVEAEY